MFSNVYKKLESRNLEKIFVSIVEDEEEIAYLFKDALSQIHGIEVFAFTDPLLALEHFKENHQKYGVVISDNRMPGLTGIELFTKMKEINPLPLRIMISCLEKEWFQGCDYIHKCFQKPITRDNLIAEVEKGIKANH